MALKTYQISKIALRDALCFIQRAAQSSAESYYRLQFDGQSIANMTYLKSF